MRGALAILLVLSACAGSDVEPAAPAPAAVVAPVESSEAHAARLAKENIIVDGHIDLPYRLHHLRKDGKAMPDLSKVGEEGDFDAARAKLGGLDAPFMSIYIPSKHQKQGGAKKLADELIDSVEAIAQKWPEDFAMAKSPSEVQLAGSNTGPLTTNWRKTASSRSRPMCWKKVRGRSGCGPSLAKGMPVKLCGICKASSTETGKSEIMVGTDEVSMGPCSPGIFTASSAGARPTGSSMVLPSIMG